MGRTRSVKVHFACPTGSTVVAEAYPSVDASASPELARGLLEVAPDRALNVARCPETGDAFLIHMPVVYHDPDNQLFVLVLPESQRHRLLAARSELLAELADDDAVVPDYVADFATVFGPVGLKRFLEGRAEQALEERRAADELDARRRALAESAERLARDRDRVQAHAAAIEAKEAEVAAAQAELSRRAQELADGERALESQRAELASAKQAALERGRTPGPRAPEPVAFETGAPDMTVPTPAVAATQLYERDQSGDTVSKIHPGASEVQVSVIDQLIPEPQGPTTQEWQVGQETGMVGFDRTGTVRFAVAVDASARRYLSGEHLQVKLQLHRLPGGPVASLAVGPAGAMDEAARLHEVWIHDFDLADATDRELVAALARDFRFALDVYTEQREPVGRRMISAELGDNASYLLAVADAYLDSIAAAERSPARARAMLSDPDFDRFALGHPERATFRDDRLRALGRPADVRRAITVARRFSKPEREEYLILTRGYPLSRWRQRRRRVIARAIELGLWMGPRLAHVAISEGMALSRTELVTVLLRNFAELIADGGHGLEEAAVRDNWEALREEAGALGVSPSTRRTEPIHSEREPAVSGTIGTPVTQRPEDPLIAKLSRDDQRVEAALEIAQRGEAERLPMLFEAIGQMNRSDAGRVLGAIPAFGHAAVPFLIDGLQSRKGFIRQGCALALGVIGGDEACEALCDLLIAEPTEIWREVARAIGMIGGAAASAVVVRVRKGPQHRERAAWALANIVVGDGARVVESLARGRDRVASEVAKRARELAGRAKREDDAVRAPVMGREVTVNRAFSRRFFEALGGVVGAPVGGESSAPAILLQDDDLLDAAEIEDDEAELLDDADLIPT